MKSALQFSLVLFILSIINSFGQTYLNENFDNGMPSGFTINNGGTTQDTWMVVNSYTENGSPRTLNGSPFLFVNGDPPGPTSTMDEFLTTPSMNTTAAPQVFLQFVQYFRDYGATNSDSANIEVFDGSDWIKVLNQVTTQGSWTSPRVVRINLTQYKNPGMRIRFRFVGDWPWYWAIDNMRVFVPQARDLSPVAVTAPVNDCNLGPSVQLKLRITNLGTATQSNFPVSYRVNGGTPVTETFSGNLFANATQEFTFSTPANLSIPGVYSIDFWTGLANDAATDNDTLKNFILARYPNGFPKQEFVNYDGINLAEISPGWREVRGYNSAGAVSNWVRNSPIQQVGFGSVGAKVNLFGTEQKEWLVSPAFIPSESTGLVFKCAVTDWSSMDSDFMGSDDSLKVRVTTNCGQSWRTIFFLDANSGLTNQYRNIIIPLSQFAGQEIKVAIYATDGKVNNDEDYDLHIDDVEIRTLPDVDVGIVGFKSPLTGCGLGNLPVTVTIRNYGSKTQRNFPIRYRLNNQTVITETFADSVRPNQTRDFTFAALGQIAAPGFYTFNAWTAAPGDANIFNDSTKNYRIENSIAISTFPYNENFENGDGGWKTGGLNSSWALGSPQKSIINSPAQGQNSWVTGGLGTGTYNSNEKSFVLAPCFNFSTLVNPVIEMKVWWHSEWSADGALLQYSKNNGANWFNVGEFGDPNNWYNDNTVFAVSQLANPQHAWTGGSLSDQNGSGGWVTVRNFLKGLGGVPLVRLRVVFGSNITIPGDGFGFDEVKIYESPLKDAELTSVSSPSPEGCGFTGNTAVTIRVSNKGRQVLSNIPVRYQVNNLPVVQEVIAGPLDTNAVISHTFQTSANLSQPGAYNFRFWVSLPEDGISSNDSVKNHFIRVYDNAIDTVTFTEFNGVNLNQINAGWREAQRYRPAGSSSGWANCNSQQQLFFGSRTARVNLFNNVVKEWMISPPFTCEATTRLGFRIAKTARDGITNAPMGLDDSVAVMVSTNCGQSWQQIYLFTRDSVLTNQFKNYRLSLNSYAGQRIQIGFYASSGSINNPQECDIHLDNIYMIPSPARDLAVTGILDPTRSCGLSATQAIKIRIFNNGALDASNYSIFYQVNNQPVVSQQVNQTLASNQSTEIEFTTPANFSALGIYQLRVWAKLTGDLVLENDSLRANFRRFGTPLPLVNFNGYDGFNISSVFSGWQEARGQVPQGIQSNWNALTLGSNTVASVFLAGSNIQEWLISPPVRVGGAPLLSFRAALRFPGTNNQAEFFSDDKIRVMVTTNCGDSWTEVFVLNDTLVPVLTPALQSFQISLLQFENQEIRFAFLANDGSRADLISEFLLDDIRLVSTGAFTDLSPTEFVSPTSTLVFGQSNPVRVRLKNLGTNPISNALLTASIADNNYSSFITTTILPGAQRDIYLGDFTPSTLGLIEGMAIVSTAGDAEPLNDTLKVQWLVVSNKEGITGFEDLVVYPNPVKDKLNILLPAEKSESAEFQLFDLRGKELELFPLIRDDQRYVADFHNVNKGVYFLRVTMGASIKTIRLIKD